MSTPLLSLYSWFKLPGGARVVLITPAGDLVFECPAERDRVAYYVLEQKFKLDARGARMVGKEYEGFVLRSMLKKDIALAFELKHDEPKQLISMDAHGSTLLHPEFISPVTISWHSLPREIKSLILEQVGLQRGICCVCKEWERAVSLMRPRFLQRQCARMSSDDRTHLAATTMMFWLYQWLSPGQSEAFGNESGNHRYNVRERGFQKTYENHGTAYHMELFGLNHVTKRLLEDLGKENYYFDWLVSEQLSRKIHTFDRHSPSHSLFGIEWLPCVHPDCLLPIFFPKKTLGAIPPGERNVNVFLAKIVSVFEEDWKAAVMCSRYCYEVYWDAHSRREFDCI